MVLCKKNTIFRYHFSCRFLFERFGIQLQAISKFKGRGGGAKSKETIIQVPKTVNPNMVQNIRLKTPNKQIKTTIIIPVDPLKAEQTMKYFMRAFNVLYNTSNNNMAKAVANICITTSVYEL